MPYGVAATLTAGIVALPSVAAARFALTSPAFRSGQRIPKRYTCDGADRSPPLRWTTPPAGTRSRAISVVDLDANRFRHWLAWGLLPTRRGLAIGRHPAHEAINGFGRRGYSGPCPPSGRHRYQFSLYALGNRGGPPFTGHVLATARSTGVYSR